VINLKRNLWKVLAAACITLVLTACEKNPLERAGKALDRAGEKTGDKLKDLLK